MTSERIVTAGALKRRPSPASLLTSAPAGRGGGRSDDFVRLIKSASRGDYRFTVKESGGFWIAAEPAGRTIKSPDDCVSGFDLEATHGHAIAVDFLNRNIAAITLT
jgi:hypothetical protein